jgi:outer membrane protein assembly factor BamB
MFRCLAAAVIAFPCLTDAALAAPAPKIAWSASLDQPVYNPPQAQDGKLFLTSMQANGPNVFGIDGADGKVIWSYNTQGSVAIPPTVGKSQVFVASDIGQTHFLRALNAQNGFLIWQYTRNQPPECMCSQASIVSGDLLFAQSDGHSLYAFAPNGAAPSKRIWQFAGDGAPLTTPVVADGLVVFGSGDHNVYALDAKTGAQKWTGTTGYVFTAAPLVVGGTVVIGDQGGNIDGFDVATGKPDWSFGASGPVDDAAIARDGVAYLVSEDHNVYALDIKTGNQDWSYAMDDYAPFAPVLSGDVLVVANRAGQLIGLDAKSGKLLWQTALGGVPFSALALWPAQQAVVLKVDDHVVAAFDAATGKALWRYETPDVVTPPVVAGGQIDVATSGARVLALE